MNVQELATVIRHRLPVRIILLNNHGHSMIQQTQDQWLDSRYLASSVEGGLPDPDFTAIARAYGFPTRTVTRNRELAAALAETVKSPGPFFCNVDVDPSHRVVPQVKFGRPNEDPEPLLPRDEFRANMLIEPLEASRGE
jgi:acetolactate synthase-1/2/3 large subunit